jgi:hypothetical protein
MCLTGILGSDTGSLVGSRHFLSRVKSMSLNPVELRSVSFGTALDVTWRGAIVTFSGDQFTPCLVTMGFGYVEHPPKISLDEYHDEGTTPETTYYEDNADYDLSNVDSIVNKGSQSDFSALQSGPDSVYDNLTETMSGTLIQNYVDNSVSDVDGSANIGTHSNFAAEQSGPNAVYDTLTEQNTGGSSSTTLLDDGFENYYDWDAIGIHNPQLVTYLYFT